MTCITLIITPTPVMVIKHENKTYEVSFLIFALHDASAIPAYMSRSELYVFDVDLPFNYTRSVNQVPQRPKPMEVVVRKMLSTIQSIVSIA